MNRNKREMLRLIEQAGLTIENITEGTRHCKFRLRNAQGETMFTVLSHGGGAMRDREAMNKLAALKRFARGERHGLLLARVPSPASPGSYPSR